MKIIFFALLLLLCNAVVAKEVITFRSPDASIVTNIWIDDNKSMGYQVWKAGSQIIYPSKFGFKIRNVGDMSKDLEVVKIEETRRDQTWQQPWGQNRRVRDNFQGIVLTIRHIPSQIIFNIEVRNFNDGMAFRYYWPKQTGLNYFELDDELSEFHFDPNDQVWWIPAFMDNRYEFLYQKWSVQHVNVIHTPATFELQNGYTVAVHEARLVNYPSMALKYRGGGTLYADLVPWSDYIDAKLVAPALSPWRTIQIERDPAKLVESSMILNLNDPSVIKDTSWIETGKYVGIWWGMHVDMWTWASGPRHGATTKNTKDYIDFAAAHGFKGVLVEGWNHSWDGDWTRNGSVFRFNQPYSDFNVADLARYGASKGVRLVGHHETAGDTRNYVSQIGPAFDFVNRYGMKVVKTGHVGSRLDNREWHHGQYGVNFFNSVMEYAAKRKTMLVVHEPIKQTGLERTFPNLMSAEGARGQEYDAWSGNAGNPPDHTTILPFTRVLAGPMDFTPGTFNLTHIPRGRVSTTLAKQLALYVVIYSPWQMASDLPENYLRFPEAFEFIKRVPTNWEHTKGVAAKIGDYAVIARKERGGHNWYLGAITDERERNLRIGLDFLDPGARYVMNVWQDGRDASYDRNPYSIDISSSEIRGGGFLELKLAAGGGTAIEFIRK